MDNLSREILEVDVLFVGAGPASLAGSIHLNRLLKSEGIDASIAIIEKASEVGAHSRQIQGQAGLFRPEGVESGLWKSAFRRRQPRSAPRHGGK